MPHAVVGLDIGGANLKAAHATGAARLLPFELWKTPAALPEALGELLGALPEFDLLAVTMTGELCDCFASKREGVHAILDAVATVAGDVPVVVWQTGGRFVAIPAARATPLRTAAANWLALATFAGRHAPAGPALLIDVGSTTTDIIPLKDGKPIPRGWTDPERLRWRELVYTGVRRTPLCALLGEAVAAELFATTLDAYLTLGTIAEDAADRGTADGRPATRAAAHARLARMLAGDAETCTARETRRLAEAVYDRQIGLLRSAQAQVTARLAGPPRTVILAGSGEFLGQKLLAMAPGFEETRVVSLAERLGPEISQAACAYALAVLAGERRGASL